MSMREHIHPTKGECSLMHCTSCRRCNCQALFGVPVPNLPWYGKENPYTHIREFEEVCTTFVEGAIDMDLLNLKAFPLILKDKAKIWLNSLRPRTIRNWAELQAEFMKKFFSAHRTNSLKRQIYTIATHDNEKFYQCWERYMETISAC